ncbi:hypothetical protein DSO57_1013467 [Entomophthora muscae]|uniref:Uncharacterized protein n=2 Tax=Entomophthora muscae TaxID=34485 RepID=A0ACC2SBT6_9FUNG|nr:hypothetical protein DSO57_1037041 [Entomophthora muscae]KAJ9069966.1 hypothetical protein DSO57_1013467 [Entomophthora muscae]
MIISKEPSLVFKALGVIIANETLLGWVDPQYKLELGDNVAWPEDEFSRFHSRFAAKAISTHHIGLDLIDDHLISWAIVNEGYWVSKAEKRNEACFSKFCHVFLKPSYKGFKKHIRETNITGSHSTKVFPMSFHIQGPASFYIWRKEISWRQLRQVTNHSSSGPHESVIIKQQVTPSSNFIDALFGVTILK